MFRVYSYANCDSCRKARRFLKEAGTSFEEVPIRELPPSKQELEVVLHAMHGNLRKLFNTSGADYRKANLGELLDTMSVGEALELLAANGNLVKRPFVVAGTTGICGFSPETWKNFLANLRL